MHQLLHLDGESGELTVAGRIDYEQTAWLNFSVRATDSGVPRRSSYTRISIRVVDENDNNPYFVEWTMSNVSVSEDATVGSYFSFLARRFPFVTYKLVHKRSLKPGLHLNANRMRMQHAKM